MTVYRVKDWSVHFENNRSREIARPDWCAVPNKQDGLGYRRLLRCACGEAAYGCFVAVVLAMSKHRTRSGWMTDDGTASGQPWDADAIALKTGFSAETAANMLKLVSSDDIGWIEKSGAPQEGAALPQEGAAIPHPSATNERTNELTERERARAREGGGLTVLSDRIRTARPEYGKIAEAAVLSALRPAFGKPAELAAAVDAWCADHANMVSGYNNPMASIRKMVERVIEGPRASARSGRYRGKP